MYSQAAPLQAPRRLSLNGWRTSSHARRFGRFDLSASILLVDFCRVGTTSFFAHSRVLTQVNIGTEKDNFATEFSPNCTIDTETKANVSINTSLRGK